MARRSPEAFRKARAEELRLLGEILVAEQVCGDPGPLYAAASECAESKPNGEESWGYSLTDLVIPLGAPRKVHPKDVEDLSLELSLVLGGKCYEPVAPGDPFHSLAINFVLNGFRLNETIASPDVLATWHFDRHITGNPDEEPDDPLDVHPLYHFQYGGRRMYHLSDQLGATMLLDPPRLMHPPMDAILAVDFAVSNFAGAAWRRLRDNVGYLRLLRESFRTCWSPFFDTLSYGFEPLPKEREWGHIELLYPALCLPYED